MKPTAANIDKEAVRWSLSWLPEGRCDSFTKGAILLFAPPTSGVYGLFNFDCQVFIGESANIQEALLRHESETDFRSQHLRPTGFTFEPCAAEVRKPKAAELIARFHPVLQTEAALNETWSASNGPRVSEGLGRHAEIDCDHPEFPLHEREKQPKVRRYFYCKRTHGAALAAMFVASVIVIFYLGMPVDYAIQKRANGANPTSSQTEISLRPQNVSSIDTDGGIANQSVEPTPAKPDVRASPSTRNIAVRFATKSTPATDPAGIQANTSPMAHSSGSTNLSKNWSVQVSAAPAKDIADTLVQRLKAKGYDGYVVQAEVKGQTYYRVRVGYFDSPEKAESVRQSLTHQEGYRDAYLTGDWAIAVQLFNFRPREKRWFAAKGDRKLAQTSVPAPAGAVFSSDEKRIYVTSGEIHAKTQSVYVIGGKGSKLIRLKQIALENGTYPTNIDKMELNTN